MAGWSVGREIMRQLTGVWATALVAALSSCAPDPDSSPAVAARATTVPQVTVVQSEVRFPVNGKVEKVLALDNNFIQGAITIVAGTEVLWENNGRNDHDVIPVDDLDAVAWGVKDDVFVPKATYSHVFDRPGTYRYFCTIHGTAEVGMVGVIVVTEPES